MNGNNFLLLGALIVAIAVAVTAAPYSNVHDVRYQQSGHNLSVGHRQSGDHASQYSIWRHVGPNELTQFERTFHAPARENVTFVRVVDLVPQGKGGFVTLVSGGPGKNFTTLSFRNQMGQRVGFDIEIYSRR